MIQKKHLFKAYLSLHEKFQLGYIGEKAKFCQITCAIETYRTITDSGVTRKQFNFEFKFSTA